MAPGSCSEDGALKTNGNKMAFQVNGCSFSCLPHMLLCRSEHCDPVSFGQFYNTNIIDF